MDTGSFDYTPISGGLDTAAETVDLAVKASATIVLGNETARAARNARAISWVSRARPSSSHR